MMNEKRRAEMARKIESLARYRSLAGAVVLEIGADPDSISARMLVDAGARQVISTNFDPEWTEARDGAVERRPLDAREIAQGFAPQSIDVVFGVAVLEHIGGLDRFFAGVRHALKPGGLMYAHGGPVWTSARGHHVIVKDGTRPYRFGVDAMNPIRDWTHLVLSRQEMIEDLVARDVPPADAEKIGFRVYDDDDVNRLGFKSICGIFDASGLSLVERLENAFKPPPPGLLARIERGPYGGEERYDVTGVTFVARA